MKVAAIDLGSNTFLLLVADVAKGKVNKIYQDEIQVTKLGQGVHATRRFHPDALQRADQCLSHFAKLIKKEKPDRVLAMATSAARDVTNQKALFDLGLKHGIPIEIIPGDKEAQITFRGATYDHPAARGAAVIDVGGGSTEVIGMNSEGEFQGASVDVGSVRLTELFVSGHPVRSEEVQAILRYATEKFLDEKRIQNNIYREVIGVAGTPTTIAAVVQGQPYSDEIVHGYRLSTKIMEEWLYKLAAMPLEARKNLVGMDPLRADVIVAGMAILLAATRRVGATELIVSTRGVRFGVALYAAGEI